MAFLQEIQPLPKLLGLPWASPSRESWILQGFCCSQLHQQRGRRGNDAKAKGGASRANYAWWFADFGDYIYIYVQWYSPILNVLIGFEQPNIRMGNGRIRWVFKTTCFFWGDDHPTGPCLSAISEGKMNVFEDLFQLARSHRLVQEHFSAGGYPVLAWKIS